MAGGTLGDLTVRLAGDIAKFESAMDKAQLLAQRTAEAIDKKMQFAEKAIVGLAAGFASFKAVDAFASNIQGAIDAAAALSKVSQQAGTTVENLSALKGVAKLSGTDLAQVSSTLQSLSKSMYDTASGTGKAAATYRSLGLEVRDSGGQLKDNSVFLLEVAKKLDGMENSTQKVAAAQKIFKGIGADVLPFLHDLAQVGELNATVTTRQAQEAEQYTRTLIKLEGAKKALYNVIAQQIVPVLNALMQTYLDIVKGSDGVAASAKKLAEKNEIRSWAITAVEYLEYVYNGFRGLIFVVSAHMDGYALLGRVAFQVFAAVGDAIMNARDILQGFAEIAAGASLILSGNVTAGLELVRTGFANMKQAGAASMADIKNRVQLVSLAIDEFKESIKSGAASLESNGLFDNLRKNLAKIGGALPAVASGHNKAAIEVKAHADAYDSLTNSLGKTIAKLQAEIAYMQKYGEVTKQTHLAETQFALGEAAMVKVLQDRAAAEGTTVQVLRDRALSDAALADGLEALKKTEEDHIKLIVKLKDESYKEINSLQEKIATYGMTTAEINKYQIANLESIRQMVSLVDWTGKYTEALDIQIAKLKQAGPLQETLDGLAKMQGILTAVADTVGNVAVSFAEGWNKGVSSARAALKTLLNDLLALVAKQWFLSIVAGGSATFGSTAASAAGSALSASGNSLLGTAVSAGSNYLFGSAATAGTAVELAGGGLGSVGAAAGTAGAIGSGGITSALVAAMPYLAIAVAVFAAWKAISGKSGGPKTSGTAIYDVNNAGSVAAGPMSDVRRFYNSDNKSLDATVDPVVKATAESFAKYLAMFGGKGFATFTQSTDTDPQGTASNRVATQAFIDGLKVFEQKNENLGRDNALVGPEMQLQAERALLAALQASHLQTQLADLLGSVVAATASDADIQALFTKAMDLQNVITAIGNTKVPNLTLDSLKKMQQAGESLGQAFIRVSNEFLTAQANLTGAIAARNPTFARQTTLDARNAIAQAFADAVGENFGNALLERMSLNPESFQGLDAASMNLLTQFLGLQTTLEGLDGKLGSLTNTVTAATATVAVFDVVASQNAQIDRFVTEVEAARKALEQTLATARAGLNTYLQGSLLSSNSPLSPMAQYLEAQRQYNANLALAQSGDAGGIGNFQASREALLAASRSVYGSSGQYNTDYFSSYQQGSAIAGATGSGQLRMPVTAADAQANTSLITDAIAQGNDLTRSVVEAVVAVGNATIANAQQNTDDTKMVLQASVDALNRIAQRGGTLQSTSL